ncbi:hypothetical protein [Fodinibius halophilus]|uniref:Uncharacterized protein n=1 Tax=Fodinibius halophilus TaxID=1736908 RepID=A0A6M1TD22_9BACT|nr:hypothetical protein [Fodinibius halophilus]NGP88062.1 hypothetical protein [Fodinibius halophilus]
MARFGFWGLQPAETLAKRFDTQKPRATFAGLAGSGWWRTWHVWVPCGGVGATKTAL